MDPDLQRLFEVRATMAQFAHRSAGGRSARESREVVKNYNKALKNAHVCLESLQFSTALRTIHAMVLGENVPSLYRQAAVACRARRPGALTYPIGISWCNVPKAVSEVEKHLFLSEKVDSFVRAVLVHFEILYIHPFTDANGRAARALLSGMLRANLDLPAFLDFTRPMRSAFGHYNRLLRSPRSGVNYAAWTSLFEGFLKSETHLAQRLKLAVDTMGLDDKARLGTITMEVLGAIESGGPSDILLRRVLDSEMKNIRDIIAATIA